MMWEPEHEIGFAYVPATVVWYTQSLGAHVQSVFMECFNKLNGNIEMAAKIKGWLKGKLIPVLDHQNSFFERTKKCPNDY